MIGSPIMKKSLVFGIICLFVGSAFISYASRFDEVIDQHQDNFYPGQGYTVNVNEYGKEHAVAQSFKPSMTPLTKVDLAILTGIYTSLPVIVSIRSDLEGNDLTSIAVPPEQIPHDNISWCSFDFPDITVVPETTYYIIVRSNDTNYGYCMGYNGSNRYPRGNAWLCYDGNWTAYYSEDCAFRTYSINNQPPNPPIITGPSWGITNVNYTFCVTRTDPEADNFYFMWNWGDGNTSEWLGPYASGQTVCSNHSWSHRGIYEIMVKLKDEQGVEIDSAPHVFHVYDLKKDFLFGRYINLTEEKGYITLEAANLRMISFAPFQWIHYGDGEKVTFAKDTVQVILLPHFIIGFVDGLT